MIDGVLNNNNGDALNRLLAPGDAAHSMIVTRMNGGGGLTPMPPVGNQVIDAEGVDLLTRWIQNDLPDRQSFAQWQIANFGSTDNPDAAPGFDYDVDGRTNEREFLERTDPLLPDPGLFMTLDLSAPNTIRLEVPEIFNRAVRVEQSFDLIIWTHWDVPGNILDFPSDSGGTKVLTAPLTPGNSFFRGHLLAP